MMRPHEMIPWGCYLAIALLVVGTGRAAQGQASASGAETARPRLAFTAQPSTTAAGVALTPAVEVTLQDESGRPVTSFTGKVTLEITDGAGNEDAELSGATTVAAVAGVATFAALSIDIAATGYTLTATAAGLADATSAAFEITPGSSSDGAAVVA